MNYCAVLPSSWPIKETLNSWDFWWLDLWKHLAPPDTAFCINTEILEKSHWVNKKSSTKGMHTLQGFPNSVKGYVKVGNFRGNWKFCWRESFIGCWKSDEEWFWPFKPFSKLKPWWGESTGGTFPGGEGKSKFLASWGTLLQ